LYRRTNEITEQGQVTDRYTRAIDQLGSGKDRLDVRIGGIYALERIARDSLRDQPAVIEVLSAYIREHSREEWLVPRSDDDARAERATRPDVQAALTVIGRRDAANDRYRVDLRYAELYRTSLFDAYLAEAYLFGAKLELASLNGAILYRANLDLAKLDSADLSGANLSGAFLRGADLGSVDLTTANLSGAKLYRATLILTDLTGADLTDADLTGAHFGDTKLTGADLTGADLSDTDLSDAKWPAEASVPEGWMRDTSTGRLQRASTESVPDTSLPGQLLSAAWPTSSWPCT
jgi:hypothetical protein